MTTYTPKELAEKCGVTKRAIYKAADRLGIEKCGGRWVFSDDDARDLLDYYRTKEQKEQKEPEKEPLEPEKEPITDLEPKKELNEPGFANKGNKENQEEEQKEPKGTIGTEAALLETIAILKEQIEELKRDKEDLMRDKEHLREENKALLLLNAADKKEVLLAEPKPQKEKKSFLARLLGK